MKKTIAALFLLVSFLGLTACGSDNDGGSNDSNDPTPTDPNKTFDLSKLNTTNPGIVVYSDLLTGSDSEGNTFSGIITFSNSSQMMRDGVLVTPQSMVIGLLDGVLTRQEMMIALQEGEANLTFFSGVEFTDTFGNLISLTTKTASSVCTSVSPDSDPTLVKIGDFGIRSTLICNDDTTYEGSWRVEDAGDGAINYITTATTKDRFNTIITVVDVTYTISASGEVFAFKTVSNIVAENYTLTYKSK